MEKTHTQKQKYEHRGVAPIIATLLMVAIAVVGGILIFVFAQGFFKDSAIQSPGLDSVQITGYDARDVATQDAHNGADLTSAAANSKLTDADHILVYIRNKGAQQLTIERIEIAGSVYDPVLTTTVSATVPALAKFCTLVGAGTACSTTGIVQSGQDATIVISFDKTNTGDVKMGRPLNIAITTGNGATFTKQIIHGTAELIQTT